jgi:ATP-binding cassette subfamily B protein
MAPQRSSLRKPWRDRITALKNLPPIFKLLWEAGPQLVSAAMGFRIAVALLPFATLWIGKLIIDLVIVAAKQGGGVPQQIWYLLGAEFAIAAAGSILGRAINYIDSRIADRFSREVTVRVMSHSATLDLESFEDPAFYDKLERARVQANDRIGMLDALGRMVQQTVTLFSLSAGVLFFSPLLFGLMVAAVIPAFLGESHFAFLAYSLAYSVTPMKRELDYLRDLSTRKESAKELKIFGLGKHLRDRYMEINDEVIGRNQKLGRKRLAVGALFGILSSLGYYLSYAFLVFKALRAEISVGELTFLAGALAGASTQIQQVFSTFTGIADQALFLTDLLQFFAVKPVIRTKAQAVLAPRPIRKGFEFKNVSFSYPQSGRTVLNGLDLQIHPGERIAIVGENGQGKTTLVKLMTRLYEPTDGKILLDGVDLRDYDLDDLQSQISVVFQDFTRYDMSVRDNIAAGRIDLRNADERLIRAARKAGCLNVLNRMPDGLDQMLGRRFEAGVDLSGGEWQRMALARAYLRDAQVLILDEPTAALDARAEYEVFERFAELTREKTAVLISHRFSTVRMVDRIVVLEHGAIQEEGTHDELMVQGGNYAAMFSLQADKYR